MGDWEKSPFLQLGSKMPAYLPPNLGSPDQLPPFLFSLSFQMFSASKLFLISFLFFSTFFAACIKQQVHSFVQSLINDGV